MALHSPIAVGRNSHHTVSMRLGIWPDLAEGEGVALFHDGLPVPDSARDLDKLELLGNTPMVVGIPVSMMGTELHVNIAAAMAATHFGISDLTRAKHAYVDTEHVSRSEPGPQRQLMRRAFDTADAHVQRTRARLESGPGTDPPQNVFAASIALEHTARSLIGAHTMYRTMLSMEGDAIVRLVIEQAAWAYAAAQLDIEEIEDLEPTKAITVFKRFHKPVGRLYGALSHSVHRQVRHHRTRVSIALNPLGTEGGALTVAEPFTHGVRMMLFAADCWAIAWEATQAAYMSELESVTEQDGELAVLPDRPFMGTIREIIDEADALAETTSDDADPFVESRRIPDARADRLELWGESAETMRPVLDALAKQAGDLGLPTDATIGEIFQAAGHVIDGPQALLESAEIVAQVSPAAAHAFVATDGLILTEQNRHLIDPEDARRWARAAGAHEVLFYGLEQLEVLNGDDPRDEPTIMDTRVETASVLLDELVAMINDGAMTAYDRLLGQVDAHPRGGVLGDTVRTVAFTELTLTVEHDTFDSDLGDDVRRIAAERFADRDPGMPAAVNRALAVTSTLVRGDLPMRKAVGDSRRELAIWVTLVAVVRANGA